MFMQADSLPKRGIIMDWTIIILALIAIVAIALYQYFLRKNRPSANTQAQIANQLLSDVRVNQRLLEVYMNGEDIKYFCLTGWKLNHEQMDFLKASVVRSLDKIAEMAQDYEAVRRGEMQTTSMEFDTLEMKNELQRSRSGLEDWLMAMTGTIEPGGKGGFFDFLLGKW